MRNSSIKPADFIQLTRIKIMLPVSLTGFMGYFLYEPGLSPHIILLTLGIFLAAVSASVLNQIQEKNTDAMMSRTKDRPLPAGRISTGMAFIIFSICLITGIYIIFSLGNLKAAIITLLIILVYNGVYTYLKKGSVFAIIPGAIAGALPPVTGWVAAGGEFWDREIIFVGFLLFTGQIPHFWLLLIRFSDDYTKAGFPNLLLYFSQEQVNRVTFIWLIASVIAAIFLCIFEVLKSPGVIVVLLTVSLLLVWQFSRILKHDMKIQDYKKYSIMFDLYYLLLIFLLIADRFSW